MKSASVVVVVLVTLGFGFSGLAQGQERRPAPSQDDTAKLEKRIAELERELATLRKELKDLRRELQAQAKVTVIPVQYCSANSAAKLIQEAYKEKRDFLAEALPKMKCVALRADTKTTQEVREILLRLDESARKAEQGDWKVIAIPPHRPDPALLEETIRTIKALEKQKTPGKK